MTNKNLSQHFPAISVAAAGLLLMLSLTLFAPAAAQFLFIGTLLSIVVSVAIPAYFRQMQQSPTEQPDVIYTALRLASDRDLSANYADIGESLVAAAQHNDPIYRQETLKRIDRLAEELRPIGEGKIYFEDGQRWRLAYEELLRSSGLHTYRSVSVVDSESYWQNEPGRRSMQLNYELQARGTLTIERVVIVDDRFWPANQDLPSEPLLKWIDDQHRHGIWLMLTRSSCVIGEPDLHVDFGIYGNRAVGTEEVDSSSRMPRFCLSFDFGDVQKAEDRWNRLQAYCVSYRDLLDRSDPSI